MTTSLTRSSLIFFLLILLGIGGLPASSHASSNNLVSSNWTTYGAVDQSVNGVISLRETGTSAIYAYQDIAVSRSIGRRLLLVSYTQATPRSNGDITGLPYLYGYAMDGNGRILSYLQNPNLRSQSTGSWMVTSSSFAIPNRTTTVRLFLKQASRRGTVKDGRVAKFTQPGVFVGTTNAELNAVVKSYQDRLNTVLPAPAPTPTQLPTLSFDTIYNGYGFVNLGSILTLSPKASTQPYETHAALVTSKETFYGNYEARFTITTESQLRTNTSPNPWETGWFVFGYKPDATFKYLILKPNGYGIELGESLGNDRQNFLWTSAVGADSFPIGRSYDVRVRVENRVVSLFVDGVQRLSYPLSSRDLLSTDGKVGFYSEDARVKIENVSIRQL